MKGPCIYLKPELTLKHNYDEQKGTVGATNDLTALLKMMSASPFLS